MNSAGDGASRTRRPRGPLNPAFRKAAAESAQADAPQAVTLKSAFAKARSTGIMSLVSRGLDRVPPEVFDNSDLYEDEKFWEVVAMHKLDLSHNEIKSLPNGWGALKMLTSLTIKGNKLGKDALPMDLYKLPLLAILDLSGNNLESSSLSEEIGNLGSTLNSLNLSGNKIRELPESVADLMKLEVFNVQDNILESFPVRFSKLSKLMQLNASGNNISRLPENFSKLSQLRLLDMRKNRLSCIGSALSELYNLTMVDFRDNSIEIFPSLPTTSELARLYLAFNQIRTIDGKSLLAAASGLVEVHLQNNFIEYLPDEVRSLSKLKMLDLSCNSLRDIPTCLGYLGALNRLILAGNPLKTIRQNLITGSTLELKEYLRKRASPDEISKFGSEELHESSELGTANLGNDPVLAALLGEAMVSGALVLSNKNLQELPNLIYTNERVKEAITRIDLSSNKFEHFPVELSLLSRLRELVLDGNSIKHLPAELGKIGSLNRLSLAKNRLDASCMRILLNVPYQLPLISSLKDLNLQKNQLESIPEFIFELVELQSLCLGFNLLEDVSNYPWTNFAMLQSLDLSDNRISTLGNFEHLSSLKHLNLANNELAVIPPRIGLCAGLQTLQISGNPQRALRMTTVDRGISHVLQYLRDRIPPGEIPPEKVPTKNVPESENLQKQNSANSVGAIASIEDDPEMASICMNISNLCMEIENPGVSHAKLYALKKQLQIAKSQKLRLERRRSSKK